MRVRGRTELRFEGGNGIRMSRQGYAERRGRSLARVIVGRRADATEAEHDVAACEGLAEHSNEAVTVVAFITRPVEREPAPPERRDHPRQMTVLAFARENFVADD